MAKFYSAAGVIRQSIKARKISRVCWIIIALVVLWPQIADAQEAASVVILPFEVFSDKDLSYMQTEIPSALKKSLLAPMAFYNRPLLFP